MIRQGGSRMTRRSVILLTFVTAASLAHPLRTAIAQNGSPPVRPIATSTVGPWEIVVWGAGKRVRHCTLVRAEPRADEPKFGVLIDQRGGVLSVDTAAWQLTPKAELPAVVVPAAGEQHAMIVRPVSPTRANIAFDIGNPLLDELQVSDYLDIRIHAATVRVGTEDFNAARVVFDICVQKIGADWRPPGG
jgi:hypothetical protein